MMFSFFYFDRLPCSRIHHNWILDLVQAYHVFFQCSQEPPEPQRSQGFWIFVWLDIMCSPKALQDTGQLIGTSRFIWTESVPCSIFVSSLTFATGEYVNMFHDDMMILPVNSLWRCQSTGVLWLGGQPERLRTGRSIKGRHLQGQV